MRFKNSFRNGISLLQLFAALMLQSSLRKISGRSGFLNPQSVGLKHVGPAREVTAEKIAAFARSTQDSNPCHAFAAGTSLVAPPLFYSTVGIYSLLKIFADRRIGVDFSKLFHAGSELRPIRLARPGDILHSESSVERIVDRGKGEILVTRTDIFDGSKTLVCRSINSWYLKKPKHLQRDVPGAFSWDSQWEAEDEALKSLSSITVQSDQMVRYARASGDYNPIHVSNRIARLFGLQGRILQGCCTMAMLAKEFCEKFLGGDPNRLKSFNVRFSKPVHGGDILWPSAWTLSPERHPWLQKETLRPGLVAYGLKMKNQKGEEVITRAVALVQAHKVAT